MPTFLAIQAPIFLDVIVILLLSVAVTLLFSKLKLPTVIGFLTTGIVAGPYALGLVSAPKDVEILAEIGVILLMFTIGLEFSLKSLAKIKRAVFLGGSIQVALTIAATWAFTNFLGFSNATGVFLGFLFSLSSTAIVLKLLQERLEMEAPHGQVSLAILIFQDIIVVPMMLVTPLLAGNHNGNPLWLELAIMLGKFAAVLVGVILGARYVMPRFLFLVAKTRSRELFLLAVIGICMGVAWLTGLLGLSLALGAFLAGLIISESEYSYEATSNVMPFREIFASFFFVSIGMLLDVSFFLKNPIVVLAFTALVFFSKAAVVAIATWVLGYPKRTIILAGLSLFQVGEFAFILSRSGIDAGLISGEVYQFFLAVSVLTMALTPFVMMAGEKLATSLEKASRAMVPKAVSERLKRNHTLTPLPTEQAHSLTDHLVVIGYGLNGRNLVQAAKMASIPYVIIETNPITVRKERAHGEPILYGDASSDMVLEHAQVAHARAMVVAVSDPSASKRIVVALRRHNPNHCIFVRTRYLHEMPALYKLGATEVIPEEFETSVEIFSRVLAKYLVPLNEIEQFVHRLREGSYQTLRSASLAQKEWSGMHVTLSEAETATLLVPNTCSWAGNTLQELDLRNRFGVSVLAVLRAGKMEYDLTGGTQLLPNDVLYVFGTPDKILTLKTEIEKAASPATSV